MNVDYDYIASILNVFINSEKAHLSICDLKDAGINFEIDEYTIDEQFVFHMQRFMDAELISDENGDLEGLISIGIILTSNNTHTTVKTKIRLTQKGDDFAKALDNKEVLSKIKSEFKDAPFKVVFDASQKLFMHYFKKKIDTLIRVTRLSSALNN